MNKHAIMQNTSANRLTCKSDILKMFQSVIFFIATDTTETDKKDLNQTTGAVEFLRSNRNAQLFFQEHQWMKALVTKAYIMTGI